jgi:hypothetical protein
LRNADGSPEVGNRCSDYIDGVIVGRYQIFPYKYLSTLKSWVSSSDLEKLRGRTSVDFSVLAGKKNMVVLTFGQSNAANFGETPFAAPVGVYNFSNGTLYGAMDPMLGASGTKGSVWTRLGKMIVERRYFDNVVFITIGEGGSEIRRWAPGGDLNQRLNEAIREAQKSNLVITHLLWHQGEADSVLGTGKVKYKVMFQTMLESIRSAGCMVPIYVAASTRGSGREPSTDIRQAQRELIDSKKGIFPGPDTDLLGYDYRYDGTHFSTRGLEIVAEGWVNSLFKAN